MTGLGLGLMLLLLKQNAVRVHLLHVVGLPALSYPVGLYKNAA